MAATDSAAASRARAPRAKRTSPVFEFCFYFFGTLFGLTAADRFGILYPGRSAFEMLPDHLRFRDMLKVFDEPYLSHVNFTLLGFLLVGPMHLWRSLIKRCFSPLAERGAGLKPGSLKHGKFVEQAWLAFHYLMVVCLETYTIQTTYSKFPYYPNGEWLDSLTLSFEETKAHHKLPLVRFVFLMQYGFYFLELATLVFDRRSRSRSDAFVYAIHHVLTVFMIGTSYIYYGTHIGILVLFFHDVADIFLSIAKCFVYTEDHARKHFSRFTFKSLEILGASFFVLFLITFGIARLVYFPALIWSKAYVNAWTTRDYVVSRDGPTPYDQDPKDFSYIPAIAAAGLSANTMFLVFLLPLHVYWFRLALRVAVRAVMGIYDDERSDDESDSEDAGPPIARKKTAKKVD